MKWVSLLKDFKEKVGLSAPSSTSSSASPSTLFLDNNSNNATSSSNYESLSPSSREKYNLELDFKRSWEEFRSSTSEKEKEKALNLTVDVFCRLVKQHSNVAQLITMLVETHVFLFVVGRAFVTDIEKLKFNSKTRTLEIESVIGFFLHVTEDGIQAGSNLLHAVEFLVSGPIDKQPLLDSGIFCCLIHLLNAFLGPDGGNVRQNVTTTDVESEFTENVGPDRRLEVEGSIVHIMKALASHPAAAQSLIEDNSLQLLFEMVANGATILFSRYKEGLVPLHTIQLHRHAKQILGLLLVNDNGSTTKYIRKHQLIKVLLMAVKDFSPESGDAAYTMGIVDLLLECVELSYRPEAGGIRLREDIHNAHGYQFLVQFALVLSRDQGSQTQTSQPRFLSEQNSDSEGPTTSADMDTSSQSLSPILSRLLDVVVNLSHTGPTNAAKDNYKVNDLEAVQMLQDIFLKAESRELQAEVLGRMFKIFSSHLENYMLCQQLRTVPLLILNMGDFPSSFQEIILKILEYAVTVVNCVPEQELLSLCCLLQQPITSGLKHTVLAFFVKLLSFDQLYKKVLREVGVLEVLLDDLKQHRFLLGQEQHNNDICEQERISSPSSFKKHLDSKDVILSSPKLLDSGPGKFPLFETEGTIKVAWDCLVSLLRKAEHNQGTFRSIDGVTTALPFLASDVHRASVLRVLSCLIIDDSSQAHPNELGTLVDVSKSGIVTSALGSQYKLSDEAKCDILGAIWRILGANTSAQRVFGEATGFSLILTTLHSFQGDKGHVEQSSLKVCLKVLTYLLRVLTVGVCNNAGNRAKVHAIMSSQTLCDLLSESGLICMECEKQVMQLLLELALEIVLPPSFIRETTETSDDLGNPSTFRIITPSTSIVLDKERIYNAGALRVPIRLLLLFSPKIQLEFLKLVEELAHAGSFNQESLTSAGCVELLLETIYPFLSGSSSLLSHALRIIEVLGAYRLSAAELRVIIRYIMQARKTNSARALVDMMERLILMENTASENVSLAPFVEMNMSKSGHASIQVPLGERSWPPPAGYSFVCWFQYQDFLKSNGTTTGTQHVLRIFSIGAVDSGNNTFNAELYLQDDGTLTLATSNSSSLSFSGLDIDEYRWHHLAVVHSKPNALAGLFQASVAYVYLNGKLRNTGRLGYSPSPAGKSLQVTIGTPVSCARVSDLSWKMRSCYLFEEVLTPGTICFMYILGRGYRGLFQDTNLLRFVPNQACGGGNMAILDSLETDLALASNTQRPDSGSKQGNSKTDRSGVVWDLETLGNLSLQLSGKKLIFALDGTSTEASKASGTLSMVNLVDPMSVSASPLGGIPRFGRLHGDIYVCKQCIIGESVRPIGGITVVLALVEAAESRHILHMVLTLLACALHQNPQNVRDMQAYRGYHLLALLLHPKMSLFDIHLLEIFFQIAACEASFAEPRKLENTNNSLSLSATVNESSFEDFSKFNDEVSSIGSHGDMDDFSVQKDAFSHISELDNNDLTSETSNCVVLSNADMVEHVLLDWTVWVAASVPIQIALLGFLENLVSMHWYKNHNLTILRKINLIQHLLVTLQRGDVEVPVLEKLVVLLGVILEDGFVVSELEHVVKFVIMTFDPPELISKRQILRESMGKHVIVRNMLLEMLIDLFVTITSEELLEQWHKIVSSKLITYFLDEAVHPTSMRWIMTLLGVCLTSSSTFSLKFRTSGGYQGLMRVLPSFYDSPDIYYILFCLIFGKPVYPRLPEVRLLDFHALIPSDGCRTDLRFLELLDSVIAMAKSTFDRLSIQTMLAYESGNLYQVGAGLLAELTEATGELQGEALMHKTYAARLMGGEASAPAAATSVLRFMVDLAKMCPSFSVVCRRAEFLEHCVDLYFSCVRSAHAVKMVKMLSVKAEDKNQNDCDDTASSHNSLPLEQEQYSKTSISLGSCPPGQVSTSSEDIPTFTNNLDGHKADNTTPSQLESPKSVQEVDQVSTATFKADNTASSLLESHKPVEEVDHVSSATPDSKELKVDSSFPKESHQPAQEADHVANAISDSEEFKLDTSSSMGSHKPAQEVGHVSNTSDNKDFKVDSSSQMESHKPLQEADHASNATSDSKEFKAEYTSSSPMESRKPVEAADQVSTATFEANDTALSQMDSHKPLEEVDQASTADGKELKADTTASSPMESHNPVEEVDHVSAAIFKANNAALSTLESHKPGEEVDHLSTATFKADNAALPPLEPRKSVEAGDHVSNATSHSKELKADNTASSPMGSHTLVQEAESNGFKADGTVASQLESHNPVEEANRVCDTTSASKEFKADQTALSPMESHKPVEVADSKEYKADDTASSQLESLKPVEEVDQVHKATSDGKEFRADKRVSSSLEPHKPVEEANQASTATSNSKESSFHDLKITPAPVHQSSTLSSPSLSIFESPFLPEKPTRVLQTPSSSPMLGMTSRRSAGNLTESRSKLSASPSMASSVSMSEFDAASYSKSPFLVPNTSEMNITINPRLLLDADDSGYGGGPCSAGASAVLDFLAEVLADIVTEQIKAATVIENILESVRLYVDAESVLVFQGLCLSRLMNFVERRLLRDDEEDQKKLDKSRWSSNLDALCWMIVDRVYMGAFPEPAGVLKTMEFLLSILQMANKDGRVEQTPPPVRGLLSIGRGAKQLDAYILAMLKNMNRTIMYCFLPSFLMSIGEDELLLRLGLQIEPKKRLLLNASQEDGVIDICTVLQLLVAHRRIIFCPSNLDNDLNCCLCINLISLLHDQRQYAQNSAVEILKYLLWHRKTALEDLLVIRPNQGPVLDSLHGGFDKLFTDNMSSFFEWLHTSEQVVSKTLEQGAAIAWVQFIGGSVKFPGVRIKAMDSRRKKEMNRKLKETRKLDLRHWDQINERRMALELVRDQLSTELRVLRQDKYGWVLHAESEWQMHLQQLVHERGIFPLPKSYSSEEPDWQLCPIEGPFRMRKKLERCKLKADTIQTILNGEFEGGELSSNSDAESDSYSYLMSYDAKQESFDEDLYEESVFRESDGVKDVASIRAGWIDDGQSSIYEASIYSAAEYSVKSSRVGGPKSMASIHSLKRFASTKSEDVRAMEDKLDKELLSESGEHLIRPYLEHNEKIKFKYNCERVVGLDKHDGIFLIGELCLYVIENFYIDDSKCICEKESEDELSVIDQALGVKKDLSFSMDTRSKSTSSWGMTVKAYTGGRAWAYNGGAWGKENAFNSSNVPHLWRMWKLNSVHEILKRDYQLRPVAVEIFSMDGNNDLLVFHKKEREEIFRNLVAMNLPRNSMLDTTISGSAKQESTFKIMAKSFPKRWQNGEISNFQYLMHLNTLAGRGYSDLTQYPVFPWVLADYENEDLDFTNPETFRKLDKPIGCQTIEAEREFKKRFDSWEDPEIPKFHYGSHYSSAGIVLHYLIRLPPFSAENQKLQGGQFDHADRLFNNVRDTWLSASGKNNTSDVKELIPEFFYMPEFLLNRFDLDLGEKQSGEKVGDVGLPPWAKGSATEFIKKHREALESDYVSENLHHWIDLIFGYKQRGKAAEEAVNVFYHYTYEGSVDIDAVADPAMKAAILAQINNFGQTPKQLFQKPHTKRRTDRKPPRNPLKLPKLVPHEIRKITSSVSQIVTINDRILIAGPNNLIKPQTYTKYVAWGFPDRSLRFMSYDQDRLLSTHENLHGGHQIHCASASHDGQVLVTGGDDGLVCVWRIGFYAGPRALRKLNLEKALCAHTAKITRLYICQPYMMVVSGSDDCTVIIWDLSTLVFLRQLPEFPAPISALYMNDLTGEIVTGAGVTLAVWSINGDCLSVVNASQLPSDFVVSVTSCMYSDWMETNWYVSGHQSGAIKVWQMVHSSSEMVAQTQQNHPGSSHGCGLGLGKVPDYTLILHTVLKGHKHPVTAVHLSSDMRLLLSGDSGGHLFSWTLPDETLRNSIKRG